MSHDLEAARTHRSVRIVRCEAGDSVVREVERVNKLREAQTRLLLLSSRGVQGQQLPERSNVASQHDGQDTAGVPENALEKLDRFD